MAPGPDFYSTTAGVIATLLLTLVVERRFLRDEGEKGNNPLASLWWVSFVMAVLLLGEMAALAGTAGHGGTGAARCIVLALGIGAFQLIGYVLAGQLDESLEQLNKREMKHPALLVFAVPSIVLFALLVLFAPLIAAIVIAWWVL
jgi:hypothetical protein